MLARAMLAQNRRSTEMFLCVSSSALACFVSRLNVCAAQIWRMQTRTPVATPLAAPVAAEDVRGGASLYLYQGVVLVLALGAGVPGVPPATMLGYNIL